MFWILVVCISISFTSGNHYNWKRDTWDALCEKGMSHHYLPLILLVRFYFLCHSICCRFRVEKCWNVTAVGCQLEQSIYLNNIWKNYCKYLNKQFNRKNLGKGSSNHHNILLVFCNTINHNRFYLSKFSHYTKQLFVLSLLSLLLSLVYIWTKLLSLFCTTHPENFRL